MGGEQGALGGGEGDAASPAEAGKVTSFSASSRHKTEASRSGPPLPEGSASAMHRQARSAGVVLPWASSWYRLLREWLLPPPPALPAASPSVAGPEKKGRCSSVCPSPQGRRKWSLMYSWMLLSPKRWSRAYATRYDPKALGRVPARN